MRTRLFLRLLILLGLTAVPAHAWHFAGTVYCDRNNSNTIDGADTRLPSYTAKITSQVLSPGTMYTDLTDGSGYYFIGLPDSVDTYSVTLSGLPGGQTIRIPSGGSYVITLDFAQDHRDGVDFLVGGCAPTTTTTASTTTSTSTTATTATTPGSTATTSSSTSTTTSSTTTSTSSTTSSTSTTIPCPDIPFVICEGGFINNEADILNSLAVNNAGAALRLSRHGFMSNGTTLIGERIELGDGANVSQVEANFLYKADSAIVRNGVSLAPPLPLEEPCCAIPTFSCGGAPVEVGVFGGELLSPGTYSIVRIKNDGLLLLTAGTYNFCDLRVARGARIEAVGAVTINVAGPIRVGVGSHVEPAVGSPPIVVNTSGDIVRFTSGTVANIILSAPNALIRFGRDAQFRGQLCTKEIRTDKRITLQCP